MKNGILLLLLISGLAVNPVAMASGPAGDGTATLSAGQAPSLEGVLHGRWRSPAHRARDRYRHPFETLRFFGLQSDMTVVELWPGGGWYTEVLAPYLKDHGQLIEAGYPSDSKSAYYRNSARKFREKLDAAPTLYGKVKLIGFAPPDYISLGPDASADMVLTFRNLHNWQAAGSLAKVFHAAWKVLKPGGIFGIVEHRASKGETVEQSFHSGYMPEPYVIAEVEKVGFRLISSSQINANPKDDHHHPEGVWTLPPTYRLGDKDHVKYQTIGESDRMTLKFVKTEN